MENLLFSYNSSALELKKQFVFKIYEKASNFIAANDIDLKVILKNKNIKSLSSKEKERLAEAILFLYFHEFSGHS